ncbi:hypothetical protein QR680_015362 [Steinernema hermaphroditum]|uniref:Metalloendopeptidase n=1 Tax=Steinernema hermaphroditum TaxID=289476 RepID=A0AA39H8C6_9BILA|nr:hypothetical protein QR680_015362 [Steinernema hermaphroditum]
MRILPIVAVFFLSLVQCQPLPRGRDETPLKGKELLRKSLPGFKDIDAVAELIAEQRKKVQQRLSHGQQEVDKEMSELIEEAKKLNPKPLPPDAPRSIAEINSELGLDEVLVEGDMLMSLEEAKRHFGLSPSRHRSKRQAFQGWDYPGSLWSNGVYYTHSPDLNQKGVEATENAIAFWQANTCLRFYKVNYGANAPRDPLLIFYPGSGCNSRIGRDTRAKYQWVSIGDTCEYVDVAAHEIGHALGFMHEQSRWDRNNYVWINLDNVKDDKKFNYDTYNKTENNNYGKPYDFRGIMHYTDDGFANSNRTVIFSINPVYQMSIGGSTLPTYGDIFEMNSMYSCYVDKIVGNGEWKSANRTDPSLCTWHITAPYGKRIQYIVNYIGMDATNRDPLCYPRCYHGGLSFKGFEQSWIPEGIRICCDAQLNKTLAAASNLLIVQPWNTFRYTDFVMQYRTVGDGSAPPTTSPPPVLAKCRFNHQTLSVDGSRCYSVYAMQMPYSTANSICGSDGGVISMSQDPQDEAKLRADLIQKIKTSNRPLGGYWHGIYNNNVCGIYDLTTNNPPEPHDSITNMYFQALILVFLVRFSASQQVCIAGQCIAGQKCVNNVCVDDTSANPCIGGICPGTLTCTNDVCVENSPPCADINYDCANKAYLCNNSVYYDFMTQQCPKTCGRCAAGDGGNTGGVTNCQDRLNPQGYLECPQKAYLCSNVVYHDLMKEQCPKTCGFC